MTIKINILQALGENKKCPFPSYNLNWWRLSSNSLIIEVEVFGHNGRETQQWGPKNSFYEARQLTVKQAGTVLWERKGNDNDDVGFWQTEKRGKICWFSCCLSFSFTVWRMRGVIRVERRIPRDLFGGKEKANWKQVRDSFRKWNLLSHHMQLQNKDTDAFHATSWTI